MEKVLIIENKSLHAHELRNQIPDYEVLVFSTLVAIMGYLVEQTNLPLEEKDQVAALIVSGDLSEAEGESADIMDAMVVLRYLKNARLFEEAVLFGNASGADLEGVDVNLGRDRSKYRLINRDIKENKT